MNTLLITNGLIFDGHAPDLIDGKDLLIEDGHIASISEHVSVPPEGRTIDAAGKVVMPGLIDAHFHAYATEVNFPLLESLPITYIAQRARHLVEDTLKRGFTTVRDAGGADYGLWRAIEEGYVRGPRLFYCGKAFSQTGGHSDARQSYVEPCGCALRGNLGQIVDGADALRKAVRENLRQGAHQIKLMVSGGIASPTDPIWMLQYSEEEIRAAVDEASRRRSYVMAHAYTAETIARAVQAGVRSIEHANLIDRHAAEIVAENGAFVVPTLVTYEALGRAGRDAGVPQVTLDKLKEVREKGLEAVEICKRAKVKLGFGTDLLGELHKHQLDELRIRAEIDSPFDVLHSATAVNAEIIQRSGELGCIAEGALGDVLIVDGNPLEDLSVLYAANRGPAYVIKGGQVVLEPPVGSRTGAVTR